MRPLALGLFVVLAIIAVIHAYWAFGGSWPASDVGGLIDTVIGDPRFEAMPPAWMTLGVAALILAAGITALSRAGVVRVMPAWMASAGVWVLALVFGARAASGFAVGAGLREVSPPLTEPFATYDVMIYSPLCAVLASCFLLLALRAQRC